MPDLGWIPPSQRDATQQAAHAAAEGSMPQFAIGVPLPSGPLKVRLFDRWSDPDVVAEVGFVFPRLIPVVIAPQPSGFVR